MLPKQSRYNSFEIKPVFESYVTLFLARMPINVSVYTPRGLFDSLCGHADSGGASLILHGARYWSEDETRQHWCLDCHQPLPGGSG